jgi:hypothetical protein
MSIDKSKFWTILKMSQFGDDKLRLWDISCDSSGIRELGGTAIEGGVIRAPGIARGYELSRRTALARGEAGNWGASELEHG